VRHNYRSFGFEGVKEGGGNWGRRNVLTGGARVSERERRRGRGAGLVWVIAGLVLPGSAQWLALFLFFFFFSFFLFFCFLIFCFAV
jgi:hypothetical protein